MYVITELQLEEKAVLFAYCLLHYKPLELLDGILCQSLSPSYIQSGITWYLGVILG